MSARQLPVMPTYRTDAVTRRMCATAYLREDFARTVWSELAGDRLEALGLTLGVNLVALVRHSAAAVRRANARDHVLSWLLVAFWSAGLVCLGTLVAGHHTLALTAGSLVVLALAGAWWTVCRSLNRAWTSACALYWGNERADRLADPVEAAVEDVLREQRRANVVVYDAQVGHKDPFVGSGTRIRSSVWDPIDVSTPAESPGGGKRSIVPFDAVDLHTFVAKEMAGIAGLEGLRTRNRLYIVGNHVTLLGADLLPDVEHPPLARIDPALVRAGLQQAGAGMRTHLSLERVGEGGRVIISMHLRARLSGPSLSWEVVAHVLSPLEEWFDAVDYIPTGGWRRSRRLVGETTATVRQALFGAPGRLSTWRRRQREDVRRLERLRKDITKHHQLYDYGAVDSLRERHADARRMGHNDLQDGEDFLNRLQGGVLLATERFLKAHHVDTSSFDRASRAITQNYTFTGAIGQGNFGMGGTISNQGGPQQPQQGGAPVGGGQP